MNTAFGALFVLMANVAWLTGQATTGPWYDASVSLQVYSLALGIGVALVLSVVVLSTVRIAALDAQIRHVGDRISGAKRSSSAEESSARERGSPSDASEVEVELETFAGGGPGVVVVEKAGHDSLVEVNGVVQVAGASPRDHALRALVHERIALRQRRAEVRGFAAGPVVLGLLYLAAAGAMLPGSNGFAATHYQLNTALVLLLSYGFAPFLGWTTVALGLVHRRGETP